MSYYHHELENFPGYISDFEFRSGNLDVADRWYCTACEELRFEEPDEFEEWYARPADNTLVSLLREFDKHVEEYHC